MTYAQLVERLEKATGPDRETDALILKSITPLLADTTVLGGHGWLLGGDHAQPTESLHYTASIDAALSLVPEGYEFAVYSFGGPDHGPWATCFSGTQRHIARTAASPAIALCIAALRARAAIEQTEKTP